MLLIRNEAPAIPIARHSSRIFTALALLAASALGGCSAKNSGSNPLPVAKTPTTYRGVLAGPAAESGTLTLIVTPTAPSTAILGARRSSLPAAPVPGAIASSVTGTIKIVGSSAVSLSGMFDPGSRTLM